MCVGGGALLMVVVAGMGCLGCSMLVCHGTPTLVITPDYSSVFQFGTPVASLADTRLAETQRMGAIIGGAVAGGVVLIVLLFTYK